MAAFLSGEMKDTVQMNPAGAYGAYIITNISLLPSTCLSLFLVLERFFSRRERQNLFRSWAGSASMWIKGGNTIWGNGINAPDDECNATQSHGDLIAFRQSQMTAATGEPSKNMTADEASDWILEHTPSTFQVLFLVSPSG